MSIQITEEAAKLRANAASSIIQNEFDLKEIQRQFGGFEISSATSDELTDKELKTLLAIGESATKLIQQVVLNLAIAGSAIAASVGSADTAGKITAMIIQVDKARNYLKDAESELSKFNDADTFSDQKSILETVRANMEKLVPELNDAMGQLHLLLFSNSQT